MTGPVPTQTALPALPARLYGVVTSPGATFAAVAKTPRWLGVLAVTSSVLALSAALFLNTEAGRQALLDQQVATLESFGQTVDDARYAALQTQVPMLARRQPVGALVSVPLVTLLVAGVCYVGLSALVGATATFRQVLAVVAHGGAILILRELFVLPLNVARESLSNPVNLSIFFPSLDEGSFLAAFLGLVDLFVVWWGLTLAIGLAVLYHRKTSRIAAGIFAVYGAFGLVVAGLKSALGGQ